MISQTNKVIAQTRHWLENVVIGLNFCPFAKPVFEQDKIHYQVSDAQSLECCLEDLMAETEWLDKHSEIETSLLIFESSLQDFDNFLDVLDIADDLMIEQGYEGIYQLASFHPDYCFADSEVDDPANYTNRAPYPIFHLLREQSIESALAHFNNPENIPRANIQLARELGHTKMQSLLETAKKLNKD
ncbi:MAG: DUF1415 domain-containing protein [Gammaproteobacteria bacterium]|jgi:uncharacterized protein|nr:DUF1415 domain-containing protein [Gammaproteobacteria bacterium]MBT4146925.1 DUF1415 domain-containing protein [Gammaproteobacteria bacterium]MBT5223679.1 DUF1415 domain-containing protein [Gammaproteobacteria bacterium]MBT5824595.1 DUF1415 domain-containing protein [Gammaproteobacteria bacterium]MBT5966518.1 DUF1415 domain-containing protein [Gammaproteobacteria bacterium]